MLELKSYNYYDKEDLTKKNLINNEEFLSDAYDFLVSRNNNTDLETPEEVYDEFMEHMRYSSVNEITALRDLEYAQNADLLERDKFGRLIDTFDKMPGEDISLQMMGDYAEGLATAPSTYLGILTGGTGKAASVAGTQVARLGLRKLLSQGLKGAAKGAAVEGTIGLGQGAVEEATRVETEVQDEFTGGRTAMTGIASAIGGGILSFPAGILSSKQATRASEIEESFKLNSAREANVANELSKKTLKEAPKKEIEKIKKKLEALDPEKVRMGRELLTEMSDSDDLVVGLPRHVFENIAAAAIRIQDKIKIKPGQRITAALQEAIKNDTKGLITPEIKNIMREHNLTLDQFSYIYKAELSEAGRILGQAGFIERRFGRKTRDASEELLKDLDSLRTKGFVSTSQEEAKALLEESIDLGSTKNILDHSIDFFRNLDRLRLGFMTSQPATTARNNLNAGFRVGVDATVRTMDNIVHNVVQTYRRNTSLQKLQKLYDDGNITEKVFKEEKKRIEEVLTNKSLFDGTADLAKFMFDPSEAKLIQKLYAERFTEESAMLFRKAADLDIMLGNESRMATLARKSNVLNTASDNYWKRAVLSASLSRRIKDKYGLSISDIIESGTFNKIDDEIFQEAAKDALEFTYQNSFRGQDAFSKATRGIIQAQRNIPFLISAFIPFPRYIASQLKFLVDYSPVLSQLNFVRKAVTSDKSFGDVVRDDLGKQLTGVAMLTTAYHWRLKQGDTNYWYEIKDNKGDIIDGRPLYGPFSLFMLTADYLYRYNNGTLPKDLKGFFRDGLQATLGTTFRVGLGLSFIENLYKGADGKLGKQVGEGVGEFLSTFTIPLSVAKDIYSQFDPESRLVPETRKGDEVSIFDFIYSRATKTLPDFPMTDWGLSKKSTYEQYDDPFRSPFQEGDVRAVNPLEKQLFGFTRYTKKNALQNEMGRVNLTPYELYQRHPNSLIDRYTRQELSDPASDYNLSKVMEELIDLPEYQQLTLKERREELILVSRELINKSRELAIERISQQASEGIIDVDQSLKYQWDSTRQTLKDSVNEEFKRVFPGFNSVDEYAKYFPNEAYTWATETAKKLRKGRTGVID